MCEDGTFGEGCMECGHCKYNRPCNKFNGTCSDGCAPGYEGELCDQGKKLLFDDEISNFKCSYTAYICQ